MGVFVCECNGELAAVGVPEVVAWAQELPGVAVAQAVPQGCSAGGAGGHRGGHRGEGLNRVVVAGCSPRLYAGEFEAVMRGAGLDPRLLARVNLREQVVYPHRGNGARPDQAKAQSLVGMAVAGLRTMAGVEALSAGRQPGADPPGAGRGRWGGGDDGGAGAGPAWTSPWTWWSGRASWAASGATSTTRPMAVTRRRRWPSWLPRWQAEERISGSPGRRSGGLPRASRASTGRPSSCNGRQEQTVEHGVLVVATGGKPAATEEYLYGQDPRVLTQRELEQQIADGTLATVQTVVMIQCVGSREPERPYCSRVCCTQAVKNALKLKELKPGLKVYVLYREVRTYGFREAYYQAARDAGVVFLRYELPEQARRCRAEGDAAGRSASSSR